MTYRGKVTIMRGLPGSGKSTLANKLLVEHEEETGEKGVIVSADQFFETEDGGYEFNPKRIGAAHSDCKRRFRAAMQEGISHIIVDNTNTQLWEFEMYAREARRRDYRVEFNEITCEDEEELEKFFTRCTHGVPLEHMKKMFRRWQTRELGPEEVQE